MKKYHFSRPRRQIHERESGMNRSSNHQPAETPAATLARTLLTRTCIYFTVLFLIFCAVAAVSGNLDRQVFDQISFLLYIPFSFCLSLAAEARRSSLPTAGKAVLHYAATVGGFWLFVFLRYQLVARPQAKWVLMIMLLVSVLWLIAFFIWLGVTRKQHRRAVEDKPYVNQFKKD